MPFSTILQSLAERRDLTREEAAEALGQIVDGTAGDAQAAAFLIGLRSKGETAAEIAGLVDVMRRLAVRVKTPAPECLVDIVGTGGDGLGTFNISTTASLVVAGAGLKVAKHGNRAASSRCGSADVLQALGVRVDLGPDEVAECIERVGIGFMLAPLYHSSMKRVGEIRRELGIRTVFNFLGPVTNPAGAGRMLLGVSVENYLEVLAGALARTGCERALLVCGAEGMDELSVSGPSTVLEVDGGKVQSPYSVEPEECGVSAASAGHTGRRGPRRERRHHPQGADRHEGRSSRRRAPQCRRRPLRGRRRPQHRGRSGSGASVPRLGKRPARVGTPGRAQQRTGGEAGMSGPRAGGPASRGRGQTGTYLDRIVPSVLQRLEARKQARPLSVLEGLPGPTGRASFAQAMREPGISLIAEVKRASPSKGPIRPSLDVGEIVGAYDRGGARALSVLTEQDYFRGSLEDLEQAVSACRLPVLRKDFIVDEYQIA